MPDLTPLVIMAAINGARRGKADHPQLPVTIEEIAQEASAVHAAGAQAIHLHVRDRAGRHVLDAGLYSEAIAAIGEVAGAAGRELVIQITTEAIGRYRPAEQMAVVRAVRPEAVSIAVGELFPEGDEETGRAATNFLQTLMAAGTAVQFIVYSAAEVSRFHALVADGAIPGPAFALLYVLGRYATNQESDPAELAPFLEARAKTDPKSRSPFMVCAFGHSETAALAAAAEQGGHCRIGFENNLHMADGRLAESNAERIGELRAALGGLGRPTADRAETLRVLGKPA